MYLFGNLFILFFKGKLYQKWAIHSLKSVRAP